MLTRTVVISKIMLLGLDKRVVEEIEIGVYHSKNCSITFSENVPPTSGLVEAVAKAKSLYASWGNQRRKAKTPTSDQIIETKAVMSILSPSERAAYLLHQHCRYAEATTRRLDYFVRCKAFPERATQLNHTEVELYAPGIRIGTSSSQKVATYSLPRLRLHLVDCSSPTADSGGVAEATFELMKALEGDDGDLSISGL